MRHFFKRFISTLPFVFITLFCLTSNASTTLDAQLISDNIPGEMHPGERRRLTVVMENTGDEPWIGTDFRFQSISNPSDTWSFTTFLLEDDDNIAPGQQKSFIIYLDAPSTPGTYESKWQMKKASDNALFGDIVLDSIWVDESVTPEWDAVIVNHTLPTELYPGEPRLVTVTVENTGAGDWTGNRYALSARKNDPDDLWGTENYLMLGDDETVSPGEQRTFTFIITAPSEEAIYDCNWQMLHIHIWSYFGELLSEPVNVSTSVTPELGSMEISNTIPTDMYPGETRSATITLENTGTTTWDEDNVRLHASSNTWGSNVNYYLDSGETVAQAEQKTFTIIITAPSEEGTYNCERQMQGVWNWGEGNKFGYFGENVNVPVNVDSSVTPELDATVIGHTIPSVIESDETASVTITVQNTGTATWDGDDPNWIRLRSINSPTNLWGIYNINLDTGDEIEPGEQKTFSFNITAPSAPDIYQCKWQMQKHWPNPNTLFGDLLDVAVIVGNPECSVNDDCGPCQKCEAGTCVFQTDSEDLKDECSDGECTTGFCDGTGACGLEVDGTTCDDGDSSTYDDMCESGVCHGSTPDTTTTSTSSIMPTTTTTIPFTPTTTTSISSTPPSFEVVLNPASATVQSGETVEFTAVTTCDGKEIEGTHEWIIISESTIGSSIDEDTGLYTAGDNDTGSDVIEIIRVTDTDHDVTNVIKTIVKAKEIPADCKITITPSNPTVDSGGDFTFTASTEGEGCLEPDYTWQIDTGIYSRITPGGSSCYYQAGSNKTGILLTDTITVTDNANRTTTYATVTVQYGRIINVFPNVILSSRWIQLPHFMIIIGENTRFNPTSHLTLTSHDSITVIGQIGLDNFMGVVLTVPPNAEAGFFDLSITTMNNAGQEVTFTKKEAIQTGLLPAILDESEPR